MLIQQILILGVRLSDLLWVEPVRQDIGTANQL